MTGLTSARDGSAGERGLPVALRGVSRRFGPRSVLHNLDLAVPAGQFLAVVGRSGSGKSTLLRLLGGLDRPDAGAVALGLREEAASSQSRIMFQEPRLLPWLSVLDNVAVGLGPGADGSARAAEALDAVGLAGRGDEWPAVLSGGQKQRVALARALVSRPRLLMLDEPFGALDALTRLEMRDLFEAAWQDHGFTTVLVTHDVAEAVALADRIVVIDAGTVVLDLDVGLARPRRRGSAEAATLEAEVLDRLLDRPSSSRTRRSPHHGPLVLRQAGEERRVDA